MKRIMEHFFALYGRRNRIFLSALERRIAFLGLAIGDLQEAIRKQVGNQKIEVALSRVVSRIFCVAEGVVSADEFLRALAAKYPAHCAYCRHAPCDCPEDRPDAQLVSPSEEQLGWGISRWQAHLEALYGEANSRKGMAYLLVRLYKESTELQNLAMGLSEFDSPGMFAGELAFELADAFAWTMAVANELGIGIEEPLMRRYGNRCPACEQTRCECGHFNMSPVRWDTVSV